ISSSSIIALKSSMTAPIEDRLRIARQTVCACEDHKIKATHRLCACIREVLGSVLGSTEADVDQLSEASKLKTRIRAFDPRREYDHRRKGTAIDLAEVCSSP